MRIAAALVFGLTLTALPACGKQGGTEALATLPYASADEILARAIARAGGEEALRAHQSVVYEGEMRMAAQGITATMRLVQRGNSSLYSRVELPGVGVMEEGVDGDLAWARDPLSGPRIKEGVEKVQALRSADLHYLLNLRQHYTALETKGLSELEGRKVWELRMVPVQGAEETGLFDVETGDWLGSRMTVETAMGKVVVTTLNDDFREVGGVRVPHRMRVMNALMSTEIVWTSIAWDAPDLVVPPVPDDVRALLSTQ